MIPAFTLYTKAMIHNAIINAMLSTSINTLFLRSFLRLINIPPNIALDHGYFK